MNIVEQYKLHGWEFRYEPDTKFICADTKSGGKQSICEIVLPKTMNGDEFGYAIADFLNLRVDKKQWK